MLLVYREDNETAYNMRLYKIGNPFEYVWKIYFMQYFEEGFDTVFIELRECQALVMINQLE